MHASGWSVVCLATLLLGCASGEDPKDLEPDDTIIDDPLPGSAPIAVDDETTVAEGGEARIDVAANDADADGDLVPDSVLIVVAPGHGLATVWADGVVSYQHDDGDSTADSFTYTIDDAAGSRSNVATVTVVIQPISDAPVAIDDAATVEEGQTVTIDLLSNDHDDEGLDVGAMRLVLGPTHGAMTDHGDGTVGYAHDGGESTADHASYQVRDLTGSWSNVADVTITVVPVDDPPVAADDLATLVRGGAVDIDLAANDVDVDGLLDLASVEVVGPPAAGAVDVHPDGTVTYTHDGTADADSFTYRIADTAGVRSNVAAVSLSSLPAPTCGPVVLDTTLGGDGTVNLMMPGTNYDDGAYAAAAQPDGRLVLGGRYYRTAYGRTAALTRIEADGSLDPTFGGGDGFADDLLQVDSAIYGIALEPGGRILAAGAHHGDLMVLRLQADGAPDLTFGGGGLTVITGVTAHYDAHRMLALQADGRILAVGSSGGDFVVVRLLDTGLPDPSFGAGGTATIDLGGADTAYTLLLQPDERIVAAGTSDGDFGLVRLLSDGTPDPAFGVGGVVGADVTGADDQAYGLTLQDGDLIAVGCGDCTFDYLHDTGWALARFHADGLPDPGFGVGGTAFDPIPPGLLSGTGLNDRAYAVAPLANGTIVVVGQSKWNDGAGRMLAARYLADGSVDPCFDGDGYYVQKTWDVFAQSDAAHEVIVGADGALTVAGAVNPSAFGYQGVFRAMP